MKICGCYDDCMFNLARMDLKTRLDLTDNLGMKNILTANKLSDLDSYGLELIEWCVDFLLFADLKMNFPKKVQDGPHKHKYIAIWSFVYDFLKIPKNSGFDYWLMYFIEHIDIMEHGIAIRCGWFNESESNPYLSRVLSRERKNQIIEWATNAPDE
jgi:hypothetical protein